MTNIKHSNTTQIIDYITEYSNESCSTTQLEILKEMNEKENIEKTSSNTKVTTQPMKLKHEKKNSTFLGTNSSAVNDKSFNYENSFSVSPIYANKIS